LFWLINEKDVVTMRVPFPSISSTLAVQAHMYICLKSGNDKEFLKCQTFKPAHMVAHKPPYNYIKETPDISRNPFNYITTIDCDKAFCVSNVTVSPDLLARSRKNVSSELFTEIQGKIQSNSYLKEQLDSNSLAQINQKISV